MSHSFENPCVVFVLEISERPPKNESRERSGWGGRGKIGNLTDTSDGVVMCSSS